MTMLPEPQAEYGTLKNYIAGEWKESAGSLRDVVNPATGGHRPGAGFDSR